MKNYLLYEPSGLIRRTITQSETIEETELFGFQVIEDESLIAGYQTHYITNGVIAAKSTFAFVVDSEVTADGLDEAVISNIPNPTTVTWPDGEVTTVTDGEVRFSVDLEGFYTFKFDSIPHIIEDITIEAVTPT